MYALRRRATTMLSEAGVPFNVIRQWLGHATVGQTIVYIQQRRSAFQSAAQKAGKQSAGAG